MDFVIRNLNKSIVFKLDDKAKRKGLSRSEYVRQLLTIHALENDILDTEDKYISIINTLASLIEDNNRVIEQQNQKLDNLLLGQRLNKNL